MTVHVCGHHPSIFRRFHEVTDQSRMASRIVRLSVRHLHHPLSDCVETARKVDVFATRLSHLTNLQDLRSVVRHLSFSLHLTFVTGRDPQTHDAPRNDRSWLVSQRPRRCADEAAGTGRTPVSRFLPTGASSAVVTSAPGAPGHPARQPAFPGATIHAQSADARVGGSGALFCQSLAGCCTVTACPD